MPLQSKKPGTSSRRVLMGQAAERCATAGTAEPARPSSEVERSVEVGESAPVRQKQNRSCRVCKYLISVSHSDHHRAAGRDGINCEICELADRNRNIA